MSFATQQYTILLTELWKYWVDSRRVETRTRWKMYYSENMNSISMANENSVECDAKQHSPHWSRQNYYFSVDFRFCIAIFPTNQYFWYMKKSMRENFTIARVKADDEPFFYNLEFFTLVTLCISLLLMRNSFFRINRTVAQSAPALTRWYVWINYRRIYPDRSATNSK